ncbi:dTDP-4-dehydrorhamnose 3,5-epimerase [Maribacter algarum]|uniref:dTDP-4-dehydrorhamnose 3,5-epimerase n=1 Tax=Maribacter algarum (ex Zhang et al. 2020) TaxID=2578118 RepID=A0A5S3PVB4_9FLAO|nr:dTDP-4-dehydrorhamnose 3,5-epimerase [Maribacter algarum]TMM58956.1 dTDP-4-dehydrorhamnose 3,5-epimerase [Maribacter algarum]
MNCISTNLKDCFVLEPQVFEDERGLFFESYNQSKFEEAIGKQVNFLQDNQSISKKGVLRGLHFQKGKFAQSKLVRVVQGEVLDVVVDLREKSETFGQHFKLNLSGKNNKMIFIPKGMAHGFVTLSEEALFTYKCDEYYHKASENGIIYNDETLQIDWGYPVKDIILSQKDEELPKFKELFP